MQNCSLEATQIASVIALNACNHKIYGALAWNLPRGSQHPHGPPAARVLILQMSIFVTKLNLYPKNGYSSKCLNKGLQNYRKVTQLLSKNIPDQQSKYWFRV